MTLEVLNVRILLYSHSYGRMLSTYYLNFIDSCYGM